VIGHLDAEHPLDHRLGHLIQQPVGAVQRRAGGLGVG
jgi:hypothetical protein